MAKHIAPPATYEQLTESLNLTPEEIELVDRVIERVLKEEEEKKMAKHIAPPATMEQIQRTLGITREDMEIVDRVLGRLEGKWVEEPSGASPQSLDPCRPETSPRSAKPGTED
jgi:NACalpha-BTF3-like transcription factor